MRQPLVSVVLPVFNAGPHVEPALASICLQDYKRQEIIVIDDGSTDDSLARIERIARKDARVRIISRPNRGLIATLNEGLALAQGDLIARMDGDDIAYPTRISRQVEAFEATPGLALCATGIDMLEAGRLWRSHREPIFQRGDLRVLSLFFAVFMHPTVMYGRRALGELLRYDTRYPHAEDFDLFRRIVAAFPVRLLNTPLLAYRMHNNRVSIRYREQQQESHLRIVAENLRHDGFELDAEALPALAAEKRLDTVLRVAALLDDLDAQIAQRPAPLQPSYAAGATRLVHFLMHVLLDADQAPLLCRMLARTGKWNAIRRREQAILRLSSPLPALAAALMRQSYRFQRLIDLPASQSANGLLAGLTEALA